jgi:hypothetical protein
VKSNNVTTTGVSRVPQPAKKSAPAKYGVGNDVNAQTPGSNSITTNFPSRSVPNPPEKGSPGSENKGLTTTRGYSDNATGFNPPVQDATVSRDGRRRVRTIEDGSAVVDRGGK